MYKFACKNQKFSGGTAPDPRTGEGAPQAIQGIVNTLFWLYCGFNFSEYKIILVHKAVYILDSEKVKPPDGRFLG